jgi:hypothetical protein
MRTQTTTNFNSLCKMYLVKEASYKESEQRKKANKHAKQNQRAKRRTQQRKRFGNHGN